VPLFISHRPYVAILVDFDELLQIGKESIFGQYVVGKIDESRIYSALSAPLKPRAI
jgi:hypothetical protein